MDESQLEQQTVEDVDADTKDVTGALGADYASLGTRIDLIEQQQTQMLDLLMSIKTAQSDLVMSGNAVINEGDDSPMADDFVPLEDLDFTFNRQEG